MSASAHPPRRTHNAKPPTTERVARALLYAEVFGDKAAGRHFAVHANTIKNWRRDWGDSALVVAEIARLRKPFDDGWIDEARAARRVAISRMVALLGTSKNLRAVTDAGRRLNEMVLADEIIHEDPGTAADALDAERHDPDQSAHPGAAQGAGDDAGGEGSGDLGGGEG